MKYIMNVENPLFAYVAPLVGAWIEIMISTKCGFSQGVAPLVGAWIEIITQAKKSMPDRGRSSCRSVD